MKEKLFLLSFLVFPCISFAQNSDFYGQSIDKTVCPTEVGTTENREALNSLNKICDAADIPNNFALLPCMKVGNCFALYKDGLSYIVYDADFFKRVQTFGFTEKNLPGSVDWVALTILAHELGHHLCQHTTNPALSSKYKPAELELQADEFAGAIMFKLGASLVQAQKSMYSDGVTEEASYSHPSRKERLEAIAKGYNKHAGKAVANNNSKETPADVPSDGRITIVVPQFQVTATHIQYNLAEQMKQILVNNLQNDGTYNIIASSYDVQHYRNDPAVAYGGEQALKKANYVLLGKILSYEEKENSFGLGGNKVNLGKTMMYTLSFEMINAKTNEIVSVKPCNIKVKSGTVGVTTGMSGLNGNVKLDPNVSGTYEKNLKEVIKYFNDQKGKIVMN